MKIMPRKICTFKYANQSFSWTTERKFDFGQKNALIVMRPSAGDAAVLWLCI